MVLRRMKGFGEEEEEEERRGAWRGRRMASEGPVTSLLS